MSRYVIYLHSESDLFLCLNALKQEGVLNQCVIVFDEGTARRHLLRGLNQTLAVVTATGRYGDFFAFASKMKESYSSLRVVWFEKDAFHRSSVVDKAIHRTTSDNPFKTLALDSSCFLGAVP